MNNLCDCAACQLKRRNEKQDLKEALNFILTDEEKEEVKALLTKILNGETVKLRETCDGCKHAPRNIWVKVCAECDDWENYEAS